MKTLLLQSAPHLEQIGVGYVPLIAAPTPVHILSHAASLLGHSQVFVKREDATDSLYGGNKVRNLEFLLGTALARGAKRVVAVAPYGSNFVAALAAQAKRIGMPSDAFHFVPSLSPQMVRHAQYSAQLGTRLSVFSGGRVLGLARAEAALLASFVSYPGAFVMPTGGSSAIGALGHVNAVLELSRQIRRGELPEPDLLVVGAGTCGTMAGLLVGIQLAGLKTKVIGVRCVDPIVCNRYRIAQLANRTLVLLRSRRRVRALDVDLRECGTGVSYGEPLPLADELMKETQEKCELQLDTTYTTKVFTFLKSQGQAQKLEGKKVLYWHTYSPAALNARLEPQRLLVPRPQLGSKLGFASA